MKWLLLGMCYVCFSSAVYAQEAWGVQTVPMNCENNLRYLEQTAQMTINEVGEGKILIVIARRGRAERNMNARRLHNVRVNLVDELKIPAYYIVFAEGEPVKGDGRVEFYLSGRLIGSLAVSRNKDICAYCCDIDRRFYPYKRL